MSTDRQRAPSEVSSAAASREIDACGAIAPPTPGYRGGRTASDNLVPPQLRMVDSHDVMAGQRLILIRHGTEQYRLQVTRKGKLILTK